MSILDSFRTALDLLSDDGLEVEAIPAWAEDEHAFFEHFGQTYSTFTELVDHLDQAHSELYAKTLEVNPEAAVTWVFFLSG